MVVMSSPRLAVWIISGGADGGQVAIPLIGEDHLIGADPLDAGGHRRGAPMGRLAEVHVEVLVGQHRAPHRRHADRPLPDAQFVYHLGDEPVDNPVGAARAVVGELRRQALRVGVDQFHIGRNLNGDSHLKPPFPEIGTNTFSRTSFIELRSLKAILTPPLPSLSRFAFGGGRGEGKNPLSPLSPERSDGERGQGERGENPCVWHIGKRPIQVQLL